MRHGGNGLAQIPLTLGYLSWPWLHGVRRGPGLVAAFGLRMQWRDVPVGLAAGLGTQLVLIPLLYLPLLTLTDIDTDELSERARSLTDKATTVSGVLLLIVVVAVAAPIVEELFFRGFLQPAFGARFGRRWGVAASSLLFAAVHLQALQFAALALFGLVAALLTERFGRLGPAIWAHVGFNATAVVSLLAA